MKRQPECDACQLAERGYMLSFGGTEDRTYWMVQSIFYDMIDYLLAHVCIRQQHGKLLAPIPGDQAIRYRLLQRLRYLPRALSPWRCPYVSLYALKQSISINSKESAVASLIACSHISCKRSLKCRRFAIPVKPSIMDSLRSLSFASCSLRSISLRAVISRMMTWVAGRPSYITGMVEISASMTLPFRWISFSSIRPARPD